MKNLIKNKKADIEKLLNYGFKKKIEEYIFETNILNDEFKLIVTIKDDNSIETKLFEISTDEIYSLHLVKSATGDFVGKIRDEYNKILDDIIKNCFVMDVFKSKYSKKVIEYVKKKYNDELEFLWEKFSDNAVFRRKDTKKWYGIILTVKKDKLGLKSKETVEVLDLRMKTEDIKKFVDNKKYFLGYHMNKSHWITIILDGSVDLDEMYKRIDESYVLAKK